MPMIAMALPIPPEKYSKFRETVLSFAGARRAEFDARCRRMGMERECIWVQETPQGPMEILIIETADPAKLFERLATSQEPFDVEFRAFVLDIYGIDLTKPMPAPLPEQLMDWSATQTVTA